MEEDRTLYYNFGEEKLIKYHGGLERIRELFILKDGTIINASGLLETDVRFAGIITACESHHSALPEPFQLLEIAEINEGSNYLKRVGPIPTGRFLDFGKQGYSSVTLRYAMGDQKIELPRKQARALRTTGIVKKFDELGLPLEVEKYLNHPPPDEPFYTPKAQGHKILVYDFSRLFNGSGGGKPHIHATMTRYEWPLRVYLVVPIDQEKFKEEILEALKDSSHADLEKRLQPL